MKDDGCEQQYHTVSGRVERGDRKREQSGRGKGTVERVVGEGKTYTTGRAHKTTAATLLLAAPQTNYRTLSTMRRDYIYWPCWYAAACLET